ncbi:MAG: DUF1156 domain-containing protein [Leptolyngbya sp. PLA3]|nr:DUF1156 domain-containing protein [Leptolyngbya sp. PL-A3]
MPGIGPHPKGIHHWWARLPLPTARAVLFASVVDDPSEHPDRFPTEDAQNAERERLFDILRSMMEKRLHDRPEIYEAAHAEMLKHCDGRLPAVYDPFAGGGSIPLEANRLGLEAHAADLNPVAVLLNKCNLELAPRWTNHPPVNPEDRETIGGADAWRGTHGLAADVRYYAALISDRAHEKIGHLYPKVRLPKENGGAEADVIAWIWARTVASPDPAVQGKHVPLISTYWLSSKKGTLAWLSPVIDRGQGTWRFDVRTGPPENRAAVAAGTKVGRGAKFRCLLSGEPIGDKHIKEESKAGRLKESLLAVVADSRAGRAYVPINTVHVNAASVPAPSNVPQDELAHDPRNIWCIGYGVTRFNQLFTSRQLVAITVLADCVGHVAIDIIRDAEAVGMAPDNAKSYANTVTTFLGLALDRCCDFNNSLCRWSPTNEKVMNLFSRQAIPMVWDFAEANILGKSVGAWHTCSQYVAGCIQVLTAGSQRTGHARQIDAASGANGLSKILVSTDPPYYDNISYAGLSDFFYVWLRRSIGTVHSDLCSTVLVPKAQELTASPERFDGDKEKAKQHFESGFRSTFTALREKMDPRFPLTVYYAFKQEDESSGATDDHASSIDLTTGWETLLEALNSSGFQITGTWPVRASQQWRMVAMGTNALASYIVLACRPRHADAPLATRKDVIAALRGNLPNALKMLQHGNIAPVDLAQAAIGPGMAIFTRYAKVIESDGRPMTVRTALGIINQVLDEVLTEQEGDFDADTRWAVAWFEQFGMNEESFGTAETLSKAKNTAVSALEEAGILRTKGLKGKVRLLRRDELPDNWDPATDARLRHWETVQHLIRTLETKGESEAAKLLNRLGGMGETARELAYRLYSICERKKWADEALAYNSLVIAWPELSKLALSARVRQPESQRELF